jgi:DNA-binding GntR family transcriptional regulator
MGANNGKALPRIERRRAVDEVHQAIRQAILERRFPPGTRLNVEELASQLGVSLTPVRSAIQLLAAENLVDVHSRSGTYVATWNRRDLEEIFDIRCALECLAAETAASALTGQQIARARELLAVMANPVRNEPSRKAHEGANSELHGMIVEASGNRRLRDLYESLRAHMAMTRLHGVDRNWQDRLEQERQEHEEIVDAMERRDAKALARALRRHILRAKEALAQSLPETE